MVHTHRHPSRFTAPLFPPLSLSTFPHSLNFPFKTPNRSSSCCAHKASIPKLPQQAIAAADPLPDDGPVEIELFPAPTPLFATSNEPTPLQTATSVLLTGAITVFLFRALRRRAKLAKDTKLRSSEETEKKSLAEEAMERLKSVSLTPVDSKSRASPVQAFLGAITAGIIALILYKFTTTIESSLNRQTISDNYSVRQITITIRTIINGLCYLATFVFGLNSVGLLLYSGQLLFKPSPDDVDDETMPKSDDMNVARGSEDDETAPKSDDKNIARGIVDQSSEDAQ